jgi:hypothetical protein
MAMSKFSPKSSAALSPSVHKVDGSDIYESEWNKLEFLMYLDKSGLNSKDFQQFSVFKDGCKLQRSGSSG